MRYRVVATSLENRRCLLTLGDDGDYYLVQLSAAQFRPVRVEGAQAQKLQFSLNWIPARDQTARTIHDLQRHLTFI